MLRFKGVMQNDETDCGPACLTSVFKNYGLYVSVAKIRDIAGTDREGTSAFGLVKAAEYFGFQHKVVEADADSLNMTLPLPAVAHVVVNGSLLHYIVIKKITKDKIKIFDPGKGHITYEKKEFLEIWTHVLILLVPKESFQKSKRQKNTLSKFFTLLFSQKKLLLIIFLLSLVVTLLGIASSYYYQIIMDQIVPSASLAFLSAVSLAVILLYLVQIVISFLRGYLIIKMEQSIDLPLIMGYYSHIVSLPMKFFSLRKTGEIISRFSDASNIRAAISEAALTIMIDTAMAVVGGIFLFCLNRVLFGIAAVMLVFYCIIVFIFNKPIRKANKKVMESNSEVTAYFVESINGIETIKSFNLEGKKLKRANSLYKKLLKNVLSGGIISLGQQTITGLIAVIGGIAILWTGAADVIQGNLTIGELITFNALLAYFIQPVQNLINLQPTIQTAVVASDRLWEVLDLSTEMEPSEAGTDLAYTSVLSDVISVSGLNFRYGTRGLVLKDINLCIFKGQKIAFVGESGSGKTTLVKLFMRFYDWESGTISFDGKSIEEYPLETLRKGISYISQDVFLFSGTIKENLLAGNLGATEADLEKVCKMCQLDDFIHSLPLLYNTHIDENGSNLSGGQKQRFALARAMLKKPDILILDEATSNLDSLTETAIEHMLEQSINDLTTITISHRLSTVKHCDCIFVFEKGHIIESGTHVDLLKNQGTYYSLWQSQMLQ